jgi:hypothetical protein
VRARQEKRAGYSAFFPAGDAAKIGARLNNERGACASRRLLAFQLAGWLPSISISPTKGAPPLRLIDAPNNSRNFRVNSISLNAQCARGDGHLLFRKRALPVFVGGVTALTLAIIQERSGCCNFLLGRSRLFRLDKLFRYRPFVAGIHSRVSLRM